MTLRRAKNKVKLKNDFTGKMEIYNSPLYRGKRLWDTLLADLQKEDNIHSFKKRLKVYNFSSVPGTQSCVTRILNYMLYSTP